VFVSNKCGVSAKFCNGSLKNNIQNQFDKFNKFKVKILQNMKNSVILTDSDAPRQPRSSWATVEELQALPLGRVARGPEPSAQYCDRKQLT
jgi:hypothetical protein